MTYLALTFCFSTIAHANLFINVLLTEFAIRWRLLLGFAPGTDGAMFDVSQVSMKLTKSSRISSEVLKSQGPPFVLTLFGAPVTSAALC